MILQTLCLICGFYIELGAGAMLDNPLPEYQGLVPLGYFARYDRNETSNPYGSVAVGFLHSPRPWLELEVRFQHESAPDVDDRGEDSAWFRTRFFPFRRR